MLIYFAAPLFSEAERYFNQQLAHKLESLGFSVFLPQRDGAAKDKTAYNKMTKDEQRLAIFQVNKAEILASDVFLFVLDGRVPDEGACVELGIAYCQKVLMQPNKFIIGLLTDTRAAFLDWKLNPMLHIPLDCIVPDEARLLAILEKYKESRILPLKL